MKAVGHYSFVDKGGYNALALDAKMRCSSPPVGDPATRRRSLRGQ